MLKIEGEHLVFKTNIAGVKTYLLINSRNKIELSDKFLCVLTRYHLMNWRNLLTLYLEKVILSRNLLKRPLSI